MLSLIHECLHTRNARVSPFPGVCNWGLLMHFLFQFLRQIGMAIAFPFQSIFHDYVSELGTVQTANFFSDDLLWLTLLLEFVDDHVLKTVKSAVFL